MNQIEISVKSLYEKAKMMLDDGMDTVVVSIFEPDGDGEVSLPAYINFEASTAEEPEIGIDYEEIEAISK